MESVTFSKSGAKLLDLTFEADKTELSYLTSRNPAAKTKNGQ
jgi:hypothetical protein